MSITSSGFKVSDGRSVTPIGSMMTTRCPISRRRLAVMAAFSPLGSITITGPGYRNSAGMMQPVPLPAPVGAMVIK